MSFTLICHAQDTAKEEEALFVAKRAFEDGFYDVSLGLLERFLKSYPFSTKAAEAKLLTGECYFHQNNFPEALEKFEELLDQPVYRNSQDAVLYWIAEVHFKLNNFSKAAGFYKRIIDEYPKSAYLPSAYYSLGWAKFQDSYYSEALDYFRATEEKFPKEPLAEEAGFKLIECLYNIKDYTGLKEKVRAYMKNYPKNSSKLSYLYFYSAEADYYLNNFSEAISGYAKTVAYSQDEKVLSLAHLGSGWANLKLKQYPQASGEFNRVATQGLEPASKDTLLLGKAILATEEKKLDEAIKIYTDLINASDEKSVLLQACLGKADCLYNSADFKKAIDTYKQALAKIKEEDPREIIDKLHYGLAWVYLKEGQFKEAIEEFQKIARQSEDKIIKLSALCQIGDAYQDAADFKKAIEAYDAILKNNPDSLYSDYVQYQLGICLLKSSNYDGAILAFQNLKNNFPSSKLVDDATYALGLSYFQRENYSAAREVFEKFPDEFKDSALRPQAMYLAGTSLYNLGKYAEAVEAFKNVIRNYSQDSDLTQKAEYEIADCFYQLGNEKEALSRFNILRSKYPNSSLTPEIIWWLGDYYYRYGNLGQAKRYFSSLIQDFPKNNLAVNANYAIASICQEEKNYEEAIASYRKVISSGKGDLAAQAAIAVADIYVKKDLPEAALKTYQEVLSNFPNLNGLIYPKIAEIYRAANNYDQALDYYRKSLDIVGVKEMANIQLKVGEILEAKSLPDEAIEEYLKATYLYSENNSVATKALLRVGAIYEEKNNFKEAVNIYKRIISMDVEEAKYARERIDWIKAHYKVKG